MSAKINMTGKRYGSVTALHDVGLCADGKYKWLALCDCGNKFEASGSKIRSGEVVTCPTCSSERVRLSRMTHGMRQTDEYRTWTHIKSRCFNAKVPEYKHYGGRGITMCSKWTESFEDFLADMGERPSKKHSIDRINNNGNYEPGNCRWATHKTQANNTRSNRKVTVNGTTKNMTQWADDIGVTREVIHKRLKRGIVGPPLLNHPFESQRFMFCGINATIPEWSKKTGIKRATLYWRINKQKWPLDQALTKGALL